MLEGLRLGDINPDMYFQPLSDRKIPQKVIHTPVLVRNIVINGERRWLDTEDIRDMLMDINQSITTLYSYCYIYSNIYRARIFYCMCKVRNSYVLIVHENNGYWADMSICIEKSWASLVETYEGPDVRHVIRENLFNYLLIDNEYDTDLIESRLKRIIEYLTMYVKLSLC